MTRFNETVNAEVACVFESDTKFHPHSQCYSEGVSSEVRCTLDEIMLHGLEQVNFRLHLLKVTQDTRKVVYVFFIVFIHYRFIKNICASFRELTRMFSHYLLKITSYTLVQD